MVRAVLVVLVVAACGGKEQSFEQAMQIACSADQDPTVTAGPDYERNRRIAMVVEDKVTHPQVAGWIRTLAKHPREKINDEVLAMAKRAGLSACPALMITP